LVNRIKFVLPFLIILLFVGKEIIAGDFLSLNRTRLFVVPANQTDSNFYPIEPFLKTDKAKHFMISIMSTVFIHQICYKNLDINNRDSKVIAGSMTLGLGVLKESWDKYRKKREFSWKDLIADAAGIAVGFILVNQP
jgi:uncharacterized protein YfiM (DUF2279 family)